MANKDMENILLNVVFEDETLQNKIALKNRIIGQIQQRKRKEKVIRVRSLIGSVAAMLVLFAGYWSENVDVKTETEPLFVSLPDSSVVEMGAFSRLKYNRMVWEMMRRVDFSGEGRFVVTKGERFTVHTDLGRVKVLGTVFCVGTRSGVLKVSCFSGAVEVITPFGSRELGAEQQVKCSSQEMVFSSIAPPRPQYLKYNRTPMVDVLAEMEQIYEITILGKEACSQILYDGVLPTDNLTDALDIVMSSCGVRYTVSGKEIKVVANE